MLAYLKKNLRNVGRGCAQWVHYQSIRVSARRRSNLAIAPNVSAAFVANLSNESGILGKVLARNGTAVADADSVLNGSLRILNRTIRLDGSLPTWHRDYLSGHEFPVEPYPSIDDSLETRGDIVALWEMSRMQFVPCLVEAFRRTADARYADHFYRVLAHWDAENPYLMGANWACGLDVAVRALHIALGYSCLPSEDREWVRHLLWLHVLYLQERDLFERRYTLNNHYLVTLALQYVLLHLFDGPIVERFRRRVLEALETEVLHQFRSDGGNIESALQYHQFSLEALLIATGVLSDRNAEDGKGLICPGLSAAANDRIFAATRFASECCATWKGSPRIGDSSDTRVLMQRDYFSWHPTDPSYLADWSELIYGERDPFKATQLGSIVVFKESGVALWRSTRYALIALAMPVAPEAGGHNHYDRGSFLLRTSGRQVLIDSGTYCYTHDPRMREEFRRGRSHNVVLLDFMEQGSSPGGGVFDVPRFGNVKLESSLREVGGSTIRMMHEGYVGRSQLGVLDRHVGCGLDEVEVLDEIRGEGIHSVEIVFNLAPGLVPEWVDGVVIVKAGEVQCCEFTPPPEFDVSFEAGRCSNAYMQAEEHVRIVFQGKSKVPCSLRTRISILEMAC